MSGRSRVLLSFSLLWILLCAASGAAFARPGAQAGLTAFASEKEMLQYFRKLKKEAPQQWNAPLSEIAVSGADAAAVTVTGMRVQGTVQNATTNVQHLGVDEGDIVKQYGDYLIMLRRGRLFTVNIGAGRLRPVSSVNAYGPGIDPDHAWYDEMLVSEGTVVVIGYNYDVGATEIGLFDLYDDGHLIYRATYHFHSNDYYSSRNYASRLIGRKLIFYSPIYLGYDLDDPVEALPAIRRWPGKETEKDFRRIIAYGQMYPAPVPMKSLHDVVLHTVTVCDLASAQFYCRASGVVGNSSEVFYVSPKAVYLWTDASGGDEESSDLSTAMVYRVPLNGSTPSAVRASGQPVDQFSVLEGNDGQLNVVLRDDAHGDHMWSAEQSSGSVALLRMPLVTFGDGTRAAPVSLYRALPDPPERGEFHNRFVGDWLLYGTEENDGDESGSKLFTVHTRTARAGEIDLPHHLSRIEAMGEDAVVIGEDDEDLHFSGIRLAGQPSRVQHSVLQGSAEGESRSHAFFYKPEEQGTGLLGLPVRSPVDPKYAELLEDSAAIVFLRNSGSRFEKLGQLRAHDESVKSDDCVASCVDWYGNARPLFIGNRVFALLGYELVEGRVQEGTIREVRRTMFAPRVITATTD